MTTIIKSDHPFYDPSNLIPYAELDDAIIRPLTLGILDFSNPETYAGTGVISINDQLKSLTVDRSAAIANTAFPALVNGMLNIPTTASPKITLPSTFKLAADCTRMLAILWVKAPKTGWAASGSLYSMIGVLDNVTTTAQWGLGLQNSSGTIANLKFWYPASATSAGELTSANVNALLDGQLHQLAMEWEVNGSAFTVTIYIDGAVLATASGTYAGSINVPVTSPTMARAGSSFVTTYAAGVYLGRPSLWNLSGSDVLTSDILGDDVDAAAGYLA